MFTLSHSIQSIVLLFSVSILCTRTTLQQEQLTLKTEPLTLDLYHKFTSDPNEDFRLRASVLVRPRIESRIAQASFLNQIELSEQDIKSLESSSQKGDIYSLKAVLRPSKKDQANNKDLASLETQTVIKSCSLLTSSLADLIAINLGPTNEFLSVNLFTTDPECLNENPEKLPSKFNTTLSVESGAIGPSPDTATFIKRLEEERASKAKEAKEDNRSFFAKYWIYIVPAVFILMMLSGPPEQGR